MSNSVVIIGGAAGSKLIYDVFCQLNIEVIGFMDNFVKETDWGKIRPNLLGGVDETKNHELLKRDDIDYFIATGDNKMREDITTKIICITGKKPINAIHPSAVISAFTEIGAGNFIYAGAIINIGSKIGDGTIINTGTIIEHDNIIEDYAQISPNTALAGYVTVKKGAFVSTGTSVIPHTTVGEYSIVAAGAAVIKDVPAYTMVAGCPAVVKKKLDKD